MGCASRSRPRREHRTHAAGGLIVVRIMVSVEGGLAGGGYPLEDGGKTLLCAGLDFYLRLVARLPARLWLGHGHFPPRPVVADYR